MLHNKELPKDCNKVSIYTSLVDDATCIPDVGNNRFKIVKDAVGGFFAWPKDLVVFNPKIEDLDIDMTERLRMQYKDTDGEGPGTLEGRKTGAQMSGGHFVARLGAYQAEDMQETYGYSRLSSNGSTEAAVEEEVQQMRQGLSQHREIIARLMTKQATYLSLMVDGMTELLEQRGMSHEGYRNTTEILDGNNVAPLRSDTIRLVQNGCSFHTLRSEDPNQHLKDFLKVVDSLDLDVANSFIGGSNIDRPELAIKLQIQIFYDHVSFHLKREIDHIGGGKLHDKNAEESWEIIENLDLHDHEEKENDKDIEKNEVVNKNIIEPSKVVDKKKEVKDGTDDAPVRSINEKVSGGQIREEELVEIPRSQPVGYYLKHEINKKLIEGLIGNQRSNDSFPAMQLGKIDDEAYNSLPVIFDEEKPEST
ncbi:hypothetical protein Tco_0563416 [Tanacetum coccineum]